MSADLLKERFLPRFENDVLLELGDAALVGVNGHDLAISTDTFVVSPLEFPGGNIGSLAVNGTVNDLAMMGAEPRYLSAGFVLEEGLAFDVLDRILDSMAVAAQEANVTLVAGDTKVVEMGSADGIFINTTGIGVAHPDFRPAPNRAAPGDIILLSGPVGSHGITVLAARGSLEFEAELESDTAALCPLVLSLREGVGGAAHVLRDPTRGGVASALNEIAALSGVGIELDEEAFVIPAPVQAACEMLGLDPLYVANEGVMVTIVAGEHAEVALASLRRHPLGRQATVVGRVVREHPRMVVMRTAVGGSRVVDLLPGDQLPRIC